jgi:hypothetical protein
MTREKPRLGRGITAGETGFRVVELRGFEPLTFSLRTRRATNCATAPCTGRIRRGSEDTTHAGPARIGGQPPTTRCVEPSTGGPAVAASATSALSAASRPELDTRGSARSMVRTERVARGLLT